MSRGMNKNMINMSMKRTRKRNRYEGGGRSVWPYPKKPHKRCVPADVVAGAEQQSEIVIPIVLFMIHHILVYASWCRGVGEGEGEGKRRRRELRGNG